MKLIAITDVVPDAVLDIRYATTNNFTGQQLYNAPVAQLAPAAAAALAKAAELLRQQNLRIVVWDAFRPEAVQQKLRGVVSDGNYVAEHSHHCDGTAIDLTICDGNGNYLDMGTDHDDFSEKAHLNTTLINNEQQCNRTLLQEAMIANGFESWPYEWWHFTYIG